MTADENFKNLNLELPPAPTPVGVYKPLVIDGNHCYVSGHGPLLPDRTLMRGRVGDQISPEEGKLAARQVGLAILATLKANLGSLDRVKRVIKVLGMVNCTEDFKDQPKVINGYSDLMVEIFGDKGKHARAAVGMYALPSNIAVEVEVVVEVE